MATIIATLKTVTPMLLGGSEARQRAELRPSALRGVARYWWRAALAGAIGDQNQAGLHQLESAVWGSTEQGSAISVRFSHPTKLRIEPEVRILPHKTAQSGKRPGIAVGEDFTLTLVSQHSDELLWEAACAAVTLALFVGGLGLRARRGYGTLRITRTTDPGKIPPTPLTFQEWETGLTLTLDRALAAARALAHAHHLPVLTEPPKGPTHYPGANTAELIRLYVPQPGYASAEESIIAFMEKAVDRPAFGRAKDGRQASPLWVRPIQVAENRYGLLLFVLASNFNGSDYGEVRSHLNKHFAGHDLTLKGWNAA